MHICESDKIWAPENQPEYLLVMHRNQTFPDEELFLYLQADLLNRLVKEASEGELAEQERQLGWCLPQSEQLSLNPEPLHGPEFGQKLLLQPAELGSMLADWKEGIPQALKANPMAEDEARQEAESLTLESFLGRIL